jgi:hypothetical protein
MIFLNPNNNKYLISRIKYLLRNLNKKKKGMKRRLSEQKKKVMEQIAFYKEVLQKLQQYEGDVPYGNENNEPIFTEDEIFYISMILGMRGCYERIKQLSELRFKECEKLHTGLQNWLRRVIELDPKLFMDYQQLNQLYNRIVPISSTVESMRIPFLYCGLNEYQIWIQNLINSFALLRDYESWRPENRFALEESGPLCCPGRGRCDCYIDETEEIMYLIICGNVFFNRHLHQTPSQDYWRSRSVGQILSSFL